MTYAEKAGTDNVNATVNNPQNEREKGQTHATYTYGQLQY